MKAGRKAYGSRQERTMNTKQGTFYAQRDGRQIYGVIYIPQNTGEPMPAVIFSHGFGGTHAVGTQYAGSFGEERLCGLLL